MVTNWLVCGTRGKFSKDFVFDKLSQLLSNKQALYRNWKPDCIIEGCCSDSADVFAEDWAIEKGVHLEHFPATSGNYLVRNIEMCLKATLVIAFWDGYSYGTAHTIAQATMRKIPVIIYHDRNDESKILEILTIRELAQASIKRTIESEQALGQYARHEIPLVEFVECAIIEERNRNSTMSQEKGEK